MPRNHDDERWNGQFKKLMDYAASHGGDTQVPRRKDDPPSLKSLGLWVDTQRKFYRASILRPDRKALLDGVGFVWSASSNKCSAEQRAKNEARWMEQYNKLVAIKEKCGTTLVPQKYSVDRAFGKWVDNQRCREKMVR